MKIDVEKDQLGDFLVGVLDVFYGFGQELVARGHFTRPELAGILDRIHEGQKLAQANPARELCVVTLLTAFAAVDPHAPQKTPTVAAEKGGLQ